MEKTRSQPKIRVGILGATGRVGRQLIELLERHPNFQLSTLAASERSVGKRLAGLEVRPCSPDLDCDWVFSALDSDTARRVEKDFARAGYGVISNASAHRMDPEVPLVIPEVNSHALDLLDKQDFGKGFLVCNPNCSTIGLTIALKPLYDHFGLEHVQATTLQALSGAGYPGVSSLDLIDNIIPHISGEEDKVETEPLKILEAGNSFTISAMCNRVPVLDGHLISVSVKLKKQGSPEAFAEAWNKFRGLPQERELHSAPRQAIHVFDDPSHPQPRLHRDLDKGMAVCVGGLRPCPVLDWKFTVLSHNTIRGAAGGSLLVAESLIGRNSS